jgi:DNA-binding MarR family transcriptional regulator
MLGPSGRPERHRLFAGNTLNRARFTIAKNLTNILGMGVTKSAKKSPTRFVAASNGDWVDVNLSQIAVRLPSLDLTGSAITARIFRLREILLRAVDGTHAQFGLKPRMFLVLSALYRSGRPYVLSPAALTNYLMWSSGGVAQLLNRMTRAGLIARHSDPDDGRGVLVSLTSRSEEMMVELYEAHSDTERRFLSGLTASDRTALAA